MKTDNIAEKIVLLWTFRRHR